MAVKLTFFSRNKGLDANNFATKKPGGFLNFFKSKSKAGLADNNFALNTSKTPLTGGMPTPDKNSVTNYANQSQLTKVKLTKAKNNKPNQQDIGSASHLQDVLKANFDAKPDVKIKGIIPKSSASRSDFLANAKSTTQVPEKSSFKVKKIVAGNGTQSLDNLPKKQRIKQHKQSRNPNKSKKTVLEEQVNKESKSNFSGKNLLATSGKILAGGAGLAGAYAINNLNEDD